MSQKSPSLNKHLQVTKKIHVREFISIHFSVWYPVFFHPSIFGLCNLQPENPEPEIHPGRFVKMPMARRKALNFGIDIA